MNNADWYQLVDLVHRYGNAADGDTIKSLLRPEDGQDAEMVAARANMTTIVCKLHDPSSQMCSSSLEPIAKPSVRRS
jgi:uncharacterized protein